MKLYVGILTAKRWVEYRRYLPQAITPATFLAENRAQANLKAWQACLIQFPTTAYMRHSIKVYPVGRTQMQKIVAVYQEGRLEV